MTTSPSGASESPTPESPTPESPTSRRAWARAALRRDEELELERSTGWLELFFDLVFVVIVARLAHGLADHVTPSAALHFVLAFVAMLPVAALAVWAEDGLGHNYTGFALAYLAARAVNVVTWVRAGAHVPIFRPVAIRFVVGFTVVVAVLAASLAAPHQVQVLLWAVAVLADVATPYFTVTHQAKLPALSTSKFPERFGLFTLIVLGESVTGVIAGLSQLHDAGALGVLGAVEGGLGLAVGFALWWIYYDFIARRPPRPAFATALGWVQLHMIAVIAIAATGAGISAAITASIQGHLSNPARYLLVTGVVLTLAAIGALETTLARGPDEPTHPRLSPGLKLTAAGVVGVLGWLDLSWTTLRLLALLVAVLALQVGYGLYVWYPRRGMDG
jgi:low temperature requirement protein LtrA